MWNAIWDRYGMDLNLTFEGLEIEYSAKENQLYSTKGILTHCYADYPLIANARQIEENNNHRLDTGKGFLESIANKAGG